MSQSNDLLVAAQTVMAAAGQPPFALSYGTAGFRSHENKLDAIFVRMGVLAALRAVQTKATVGVMVTASHNPIQDNGVKMIDPDGGMLSPAWEKYAGALAAAPLDSTQALLADIIAKEHISFTDATAAQVIVAMDTRPSSDRLARHILNGASAISGAAHHLGLLTTPQLHHVVRHTNLGPFASASDRKPVYASEAGYYARHREAFLELLAGTSSNATARGPLVLDCAHGIGAPQAAKLAEAFKDILQFELRNKGETAAEAQLLNDGVGAEHAQKERKPPANFGAGEVPLGMRCASLDGDADRLVYHYWRNGPDGSPVWRLIDGDKIATLAAVFIGEQLAHLGLPLTGEPTHAAHGTGDQHTATDGSSATNPTAIEQSGSIAPVSVGVVQTAYANGSSTDYIRNVLKLPVPLAKTGVKFVHTMATQYDIGIYFEANGHGTVLFHDAFLQRLEQMSLAGLTDVQLGARSKLLAASKLINQATGDALSDILFVEAILVLKNWSVVEWDGLYEDKPSYQVKLVVPDRTAIKTCEDETRVTQPLELQTEIDALCAAVDGGRAFVRPSGTEDAVRIYAEARGEVDLARKLGSDVLAATAKVLGM